MRWWWTVGHHIFALGYRNPCMWAIRCIMTWHCHSFVQLDKGPLSINSLGFGHLLWSFLKMKWKIPHSLSLLSRYAYVLSTHIYIYITYITRHTTMAYYIHYTQIYIFYFWLLYTNFRTNIYLSGCCGSSSNT